MNRWISGSVLLLLFLSVTAISRAEKPLVRAVLFYSPMCPHCTKVKKDDLPKWFGEGLEKVPTYYAESPQKYAPVMVPVELKKGRDFELLMINTYTQRGDSIWKAYLNARNIPEPIRRIPFMVIGDRYLKGANDIPRFFPKYVEEARLAGGQDWPDRAEVKEVLMQVASYNEAAGGILESPPKPDFTFYFTSQPVLAVLSSSVLLWMLIQLIGSFQATGRLQQLEIRRKDTGRLYAILAAGLAISGYLSFAHLTDTSVACGDISNCDLVSKSEYGSLFGIIPVAYIGFAGYLLMIWLLWSGRQKLRGQKVQWLFISALGALIFSIYLIAVSIFVIQATCLWCLGSALVVSELNRRLR